LARLVRDALEKVLWEDDDIRLLGHGVLDRLDRADEVLVQRGERRARVRLLESGRTRRGGNGVVCDGYAVMRSSVVHTRYMRSVVRRRKTELGARADSSGVSEVGSGAARVEWTWAVEAA
jgi:hypothetical protein